MGAPTNGVVETGGPEQFQFDEPIWRALKAWDDPRQVVADPNGLYLGMVVGETDPRTE